MATSSHSLTAAERETVILLSDADDVATITTHQRRIITRLDKNPLAVKVADLTYGSTAGAKYEFPSWALSFRTQRRVATPEMRETGRRLAAMREATR